MKKNICIVGMGISGLKSAHHLVKNSPHLISSITFFEKNSELGGVLKHTFENNFLLEQGAQGVLLSRESFFQTVQELEIENDLLPAQPKQARYLIQNEKCIPLSIKLLSLISIFKLIKIFIFKRHTPPLPNESLYNYISRHLGKKIADNFLIPFCFGIWGGGAHKLLCRFCFPKFPNLVPCFKNLLTRHEECRVQKREAVHKCDPVLQRGKLRNDANKFLKHGINFKKKTAVLASFTQGMNFLPKTLYTDSKKLCAKNNIQLKTFFNSPISYHQLEKYKFDIVIYATQPWQDKNLYFGSTQEHKQALDILQKIPTHSIAVVGLGGEKSSFTYKEGFGALADQSSQDLLGILFIHSIFPQHVPKNGFLYRVLLGGDRCANICSLKDEELIENAKNHLKNLQLLSGDEKITFCKIFRYENYIPLATEYQDKIFCALWQLEALNPGLFFTGNYIKGVSVADCLEQAKVTATKVTNFILEQE